MSPIETKRSRVSEPENKRIEPVNSPFKWVGGKSRLRKQIIPLLPEHSCYVEPFAGAAWVLFGKTKSAVEVLNDIDQELITFFRVLKEKPEELLKSFEWELASRAEFERLSSLEPVTLTDVQRAHRFYYLIMAGWGGELKYPRFQTSISDGGHGNRLIGALKTLQQRLLPVHDRLKTVIIENLDWRVCIKKYDNANSVMYIDPPYPENGVNYAHNMRNWNEHIELATCLKKATSKWILSSYDNPQIKELYPNFYYIPVQSASGMKATKNGNERVLNKEILITNYRPDNVSISTYTKNGVKQMRMVMEEKENYE